MKQQFDSELRLSKANRIMLERINTILEEYRNDGYVLTLRQLYYQLVSKDIIPNNDREYAKLSNILKKGRMAGIVDWSAIEDRVRVPKLPYWVRDVQHAIQDTIEQYRVNRMQGQQRNIEIWVEKDALSNVLFRVTSKYHIRLMVNRGYSSISAMYDAHRRLRSSDVILYFGDHDPSGERHGPRHTRADEGVRTRGRRASRSSDHGTDTPVQPAAQSGQDHRSPGQMVYPGIRPHELGTRRPAAQRADPARGRGGRGTDRPRPVQPVPRPGTTRYRRTEIIFQCLTTC